MILWNGPLGNFENGYGAATTALAKAIAASRAHSIIGGGDTIDALNRCGISLKKFTFISTGGGAMLEYLEGKKLPGIEVLQA